MIPQIAIVERQSVVRYRAERCNGLGLLDWDPTDGDGFHLVMGRDRTFR
jgi:hypothetical protein